MKEEGSGIYVLLLNLLMHSYLLNLIAYSTSKVNWRIFLNFTQIQYCHPEIKILPY